LDQVATYDYKQVFADYANGKITPEMAIGHGLQHIVKLYEALTAVNASRSTWQAKIDTLEKRVNTLQASVDRLTAFMERFCASQSSRTLPASPNQTSLKQIGEPNHQTRGSSRPSRVFL
jgi:hypothetical protein